MTIVTDVSSLDDEELMHLQHRYSEVMSSTELLIKYASAKGQQVGLTEIYAACKEAILMLGAELQTRKAKRVETVPRKEMA